MALHTDLPIDKVNQGQYLDRHYGRLFARMSVNDPLAKRIGFSDVDVPAIGIYQTSFGLDMLMPKTRQLIEARDGLRNLSMRWMRLAEGRKDTDEQRTEPQMELFA